MKNSYPYYILVLRDYVKKVIDPYYPNEIIKLIIMADYYNTIIHHKMDCFVSISNDIYMITYDSDLMSNRKTIEEFVDSHSIIYSNFHDYNCAVITKNGECYVWGDNQSGQLGIGNKEYCRDPQLLLLDVKLISLGVNYMVALTQSNECYGWGDNYYGQLGLGDNKKKYSPTKIIFENKIISIACGYNHSMAIVNFKCFSWGCNYHGQLGLGHAINMNLPQKINIHVEIISISCEDDHSIALTIFNELYIWGRNNRFQLGLGDTNNRNLPVKLELSAIVSVSSFHDSTIVLNRSGQLYGWGNNYCGYLGLGDNMNKSRPTKIDLCEKIISFKIGMYRAVAITNKNNIYMWGKNAYESELNPDINYLLPIKFNLII